MVVIAYLSYPALFGIINRGGSLHVISQILGNVFYIYHTVYTEAEFMNVQFRIIIVVDVTRLNDYIS